MFNRGSIKKVTGQWTCLIGVLLIKGYWTVAIFTPALHIPLGMIRE